MTPERLSTIFRELLQTPDTDLDRFAQRAGLRAQPLRDDLRRCHHLLLTIGRAIEAANPADWAQVRGAFEGLQASQAGQHPTSAAAQAAQQSNQQPMVEKPAWVRDLPPTPSLGDPAPGTAAYEERLRKHARHLPQAPGMTPPTTATTAPPAAVTPMNPSVGSAPSLPQGGQYASEPPREHYGIEPDPPPLMLEPDPDPAAPAPPGPPPAPARRDHRPLPAAAVNPEQIPNLSVAQYAAFCAACANAPERLAITMSEYGVANERVKAALDALWQDRFDDEPEQLQQWEHLFAQFRGQLKR